MAYTPSAPNWSIIKNQEAHQVTGSTSNPDLVYPFPTGALPTPLQQLPGLSEAYVSGYAFPYQDVRDVTVQGELAVTRVDDGTGKAYVYFFGVSGSQVYFSGPYKQFEFHHYDTGSGVPIDRIFGVSPSPERRL